MGASQHLFRVDGVNHAPVLDDTDDISTRHGGSAILRDVLAMFNLLSNGAMRVLNRAGVDVSKY